MPSTLHFTVWNKLVRTSEDAKVVEFLSFGFCASYQGLVSNPTTDNHPPTHTHASDAASYITTEVMAGAMLGPFDHKPFTPSCQALVTKSKKDSHLRRVIMDLS